MPDLLLSSVCVVVALVMVAVVVVFVTVACRWHYKNLVLVATRLQSAGIRGVESSVVVLQVPELVVFTLLPLLQLLKLFALSNYATGQMPKGSYNHQNYREEAS